MAAQAWADPAALEPGRDYPRTLSELIALFPDDAAVARFLERLRWPEGFECRLCGTVGEEPWRSESRPGVLVCRQCDAQTRLTAGTPLEGTRTPLVVWAQAGWLFTTSHPGISARTLQRTLGVSYKVAWALLQRLRVATTRQPRPLLEGVVEVDETIVGGVREGGARGRGSPDKSYVVIACERPEDRPRFGRVRMRLVPAATEEHLLAFVRDAVAPGSDLRTDAHPGYQRAPELGYGLEQVALVARENPAHDFLPAVHRVASLLKRQLLGTYQGAVSHEHLPTYLEELTFRWNRRQSRERGLLFYRLFEQAMRAEPTTRDELRYGYWRADWAPAHGQGDLEVLYVASHRADEQRIAAAFREALEAHPRLRVRTVTDPLTARQHAGLLRPAVVLIDAAQLTRRPKLPRALGQAARTCRVVLHDRTGMTGRRGAVTVGASHYTSASYDKRANLIRQITHNM